MGFFGRKKGKYDRLKATKRKYTELRRCIEETPEKYDQADLERLLNYEQEMLNAGVNVERKFGSSLLKQLQQSNLPTQAQPVSPQFPQPGYQMHPSQMPHQQMDYEQVTTERKTWGKANMNEPFTTTEERVNPATGRQTATLGSVVAVCGKVLPQAEVPGFCDVCKGAVCHHHLNYCEGYENISCGMILCPQHIQYFIDSEGNRTPCCPEHFQMRSYYQKV